MEEGPGRDPQYLECRQALLSTAKQWLAIYANAPETPLTNSILDLRATNQSLFYRIKAER